MDSQNLLLDFVYMYRNTPNLYSHIFSKKFNLGREREIEREILYIDSKAFVQKLRKVPIGKKKKEELNVG